VPPGQTIAAMVIASIVAAMVSAAVAVGLFFWIMSKL
jgi:hypothetical protein